MPYATPQITRKKRKIETKFDQKSQETIFLPQEVATGEKSFIII